ncbi:MAG: hypothetical protein QG657_153 [Acidobacteriota bacterium]|nr:hypothetical protein [Acidobacteriota bacterium]
MNKGCTAFALINIHRLVLNMARGMLAPQI